MSRYAVAIVVVAVLSGCATKMQHSNFQDGYDGPMAIIRDSYDARNSIKADFFCVEKIDGVDVENSRINTKIANRGRGMSMNPIVAYRGVLPKESTFFVVGRTEYAAPILALAGSVYEIKGEVRFTPEVDKTYVVRGELEEDHSAVWIEEKETGEIMGKKIEIKGSAKLGMLEK